MTIYFTKEKWMPQIIGSHPTDRFLIKSNNMYANKEIIKEFSIFTFISMVSYIANLIPYFILKLALYSYLVSWVLFCWEYRNEDILAIEDYHEL